MDIGSKLLGNLVAGSQHNQFNSKTKNTPKLDALECFYFQSTLSNTSGRKSSTVCVLFPLWQWGRWVQKTALLAPLGWQMCTLRHFAVVPLVAMARLARKMVARLFAVVVLPQKMRLCHVALAVMQRAFECLFSSCWAVGWLSFARHCQTDSAQSS